MSYFVFRENWPPPLSSLNYKTRLKSCVVKTKYNFVLLQLHQRQYMPTFCLIPAHSYTLKLKLITGNFIQSVYQTISLKSYSFMCISQIIIGLFPISHLFPPSLFPSFSSSHSPFLPLVWYVIYAYVYITYFAGRQIPQRKRE